MDSYDSKPYWFRNYTDIFVTLVAKNYSDLVIGKLALFMVLFLDLEACVNMLSRQKVCSVFQSLIVGN